MKDALLVYQTDSQGNIFNIGDYIQSLAAAQFLKGGITYINRDHLNLYEGEDVKLIMNGWFMHNPQNWPPSDKIHPLFVSFHLNVVAYSMLNDKGISYFKKYEPIGCRDIQTMQTLQEHGIKSYFSGCLTLTLGLTYKTSNRENKNIYFTDIYVKSEKRFFRLVTLILKRIWKIQIILWLTRKRTQSITLINILRTISFYDVYSKLFTDDVLLNAIYIKHEINDDFDGEISKFRYAKKILDDYANAKFVVTSRIHCALPCIALETPVLYIDNVKGQIDSECRLNGLKQLFHCLTYRNNVLHCDLTTNKIGMNFLFENKKDYMVLKEYLIKNVKHLCKNSINILE